MAASAALAASLASAVTASAALVVTKTADTNDGQCNADCSLREAIDAANVDPFDPDTIKLKAKTYKLTIAGAEEDGNAQGDLDVTDDLTITGAGPKATTIKGAWTDPDPPDRLLDMPTNPDFELAVSNLTLTGGNHSAGAVFVRGQAQTLKLTGVRVASNESPSGFAAIFNTGQATISRTVFSRNDSETSAPFASQGSIDLTNVTFDHNTAGEIGGAVLDDGISAELRNVTFSNNTSADAGGAMFAHSVDTVLTNVTFSGNHADGNGGALVAGSGSTTVLNNLTITDNETEGDGGGLYVGSAGVTLNNSIVAGNRDLSDDVSAPDCAGPFPWSSQGYVLLGTDTGCDHTDPVPGFRIGPAKLKPLDDNGGFTKTHALKASSPAKNGGNPAAPGSTDGACEKKDQRGVKRPQHGRCDMGAYELK